MKKVTLLLVIVACVAASFTMSSCKSTKKAAKKEKVVQVQNPFVGNAYVTNSDFFRATQFAKSTDLVTAKKLALANANGELAKQIKNVAQSVVTQYVAVKNTANSGAFTEKVKNIVADITKNIAPSVRTISEKTQQVEGGAYQHWVAVEVSKIDIFKSIEDAILKDTSLKADFDKFQFEKLFNAEMQKK